MKKTMLVLIIAMLLVPAGLFAGIFDLSIGATAQYNGSLVIEEMEWQEGMADINNYEFGPDLRIRLLFAEVGLAGLYSPLASGGHKISGILTGGLSLDLLGLLRVGLGMGPRMAIEFDEDFGNPQIRDGGGNLVEGNFEDAFMNAPMTYRATVDLKLGRILLGMNYIINSNGFTFAQENYDKLLPDFTQGGTVGVSALFTIF